MKKQYFGTDGIRGTVGKKPITADFMLRLGNALGKVLKGYQKRPRIVIGKDTRISGYMFESTLEAGLSASGADILLLGVMPTPGVAFLTRSMRAHAGIVISASHNPYFDNGIKFFTKNGEKLPDMLELAIEAELDKPFQTVGSDELGRARRVEDAPGRYIEFCKNTMAAGVELNGMRIVLDCANGATYHVGARVLTELGADVVLINAEPDGMNINENCGSTNLDMLSKVVRERGAHVGIAFDGDGDRCQMVDEKGEYVDGDEILYVIARARKKARNLPGAVVGTLMSNIGLERAFQQLKIPFRRSQVGDRYVLQMLKENGWVLGGETSGHLICLDKATTGDGIVCALQVLEIMVESGESLGALRSGLAKYPQLMVNVPVAGKVDLAASEKVQASVRSAEKELGEEGRVILRPSGTEPVVRVTIEGPDHDHVKTLSERLAATVKEEFAA